MENAVAEDYHRLGNYQSAILFAVCVVLGYPMGPVWSRPLQVGLSALPQQSVLLPLISPCLGWADPVPCREGAGGV